MLGVLENIQSSIFAKAKIDTEERETVQKVLEDADLTKKEIDEIARAIAQRSMSDCVMIVVQMCFF